jgi:heme A synthase
VNLARFAWGTLAYSVAVILWGAYVRASGSGAGCGSHWPLCNGEVIPRAASVQTLIEYSHRLTSGLALLLVVWLAAWTWRALPPGHRARRAAALSLFFMLTEAAVGAGLVLFQLVADNASMARALFMAVHLVNTFLLLMMLTLTAYWSSGGPAITLTSRPAATLAVVLGGVGVLVVATSGAVAALGDTLFPAVSLTEALAADLSSTSHALIRLRVLHPVFAVAIGLGLAAGIHRLMRVHEEPAGRWAARVVTITTLLQLGAGFLNVLLLAPVWLQVTHLLLADVLWIAFVVAGASVLADPRAVVVPMQQKLHTATVRLGRQRPRSGHASLP